MAKNAKEVSKMLTVTCKNFRGYESQLSANNAPLQKLNPKSYESLTLDISINLDSEKGTFTLRTSPDDGGIDGKLKQADIMRSDDLTIYWGQYDIGIPVYVGLSKNIQTIIFTSYTMIPESFFNSENKGENKLVLTETMHGECIYN